MSPDTIAQTDGHPGERQKDNVVYTPKFPPRKGGGGIIIIFDGGDDSLLQQINLKATRKYHEEQE